MNPWPAGAARVCVVGAGAIGGLFGARLAQGHAQVSVLARGATLAALQSRGWGLEHQGQRAFAPVLAVDDPGQLGPQDVVLLAVKAPSLPQVAVCLAPLLGPHTIVVPAMNGVPWWFGRDLPGLESKNALESVDPGGRLRQLIPHEAVVGAVVYPACSRPEPGVTRHDSGTRLVFGEPAGGASPRLAAWVDLLQRTGLDAVATDDIHAELWRKLLGNAAFNPVSLLVGVSTDRLIDDPGLRALFAQLMQETLALGRALGLALDVVVDQRIAQTRQLGAVKTSMLQDAEAGRPVELQAVLGAVLELGDRLGMALPASRIVHALARGRSRALGLLPQVEAPERPVPTATRPRGHEATRP